MCEFYCAVFFFVQGMLKPGNPTSRSGTIMGKSWTLERGLCYKYIDLAPNMFSHSFILFICCHVSKIKNYKQVIPSCKFSSPIMKVKTRTNQFYWWNLEISTRLLIIISIMVLKLECIQVWSVLGQFLITSRDHKMVDVLISQARSVGLGTQGTI